MKGFMYVLYSRAAVPLALFLIQILRPLLNGKLREMIEDKNTGFYKIKKPHSENELALARPLWIHAASGEIEYARPVIREFKKNYPTAPVMITYSSPSAKKILESLHDVDLWAALPWDVEPLMRGFIKKWNPRALLFARTDVWPTLAVVAKSENIPTILFSATFADNSSRLNGPTRFLTAHSLECLQQIHCVSDEDRKNLDELHLHTPVAVSGDTRFDQVFHRLENPRELKNSLMPLTDDFVFIAGSTWSEDEAVLLPALVSLKQQKIKIMLAPHEVSATHLAHLKEKLRALGLSVLLYSEATAWKDEVLLIDRVGILAELYTWADIAFIGGSFKKQVHSVMEAMAAGLPVMVGPYHTNNREALYYQKKTYSAGMIVQVVHTTVDVQVLVERLRKKILHIPQIKAEIRAEIGRNKNSTHRVLSAIDELIK